MVCARWGQALKLSFGAWPQSALKFVDGGLEAFEEQADMVAVDETVVCREGDVDHPSPVALHIFAPIDSGDGIVRILHARIDECGGIEIWRT